MLYLEFLPHCDIQETRKGGGWRFKSFSGINSDRVRHEEGHIEQRINCRLSFCFFFFFFLYTSVPETVDRLWGKIYVAFKLARNVRIYHQKSVGGARFFWTHECTDTDTSDYGMSHKLWFLLPYCVDIGLNDPWHCIWAAPPLIRHRHLLLLNLPGSSRTNVDSYLRRLSVQYNLLDCYSGWHLLSPCNVFPWKHFLFLSRASVSQSSAATAPNSGAIFCGSVPEATTLVFTSMAPVVLC